MKEDGTDWVDILQSKGMAAPMTAEGQYAMALSVPCPWHKCHAPAGQRCVPGAIFPQYPHTTRLQAAAVEAKA